MDVKWDPQVRHVTVSEIEGASSPDYDKILTGNLSDFEGWYANGKGDRIVLNFDGTTNTGSYEEDSIVYTEKADTFTKHENGSYTWSIGLKDYDAEYGYSVWLYPIGIEVYTSEGLVPTDTTKVRLYTGHDFQPLSEMPDWVFYPAN